MLLLAFFLITKHVNPFFQDDTCMHLTNYAVNKHSKDFIRDEETGSKRCVCTFSILCDWQMNLKLVVE